MVNLKVQNPEANYLSRIWHKNCSLQTSMYLWSLEAILYTAFHKEESCPLACTWGIQSCYFMYLSLSTLAQRLSLTWMMSHPSFIINTLFMMCMCFKPNPPSSLGWQRVFQLTRWTLPFSSFPPQMNRRQIFSISGHEDFGSKEDCIGYNGTDDLRTNLHKVILSAKVRLLAFHLANFCYIFSMI